MSNGLVDRELHLTPRRKVQDWSILCVPHDQTNAGELLVQFVSSFPVKDMPLSHIVALGFDPKSYSLSTNMTVIWPSTPIPSKFVNDFLTKIWVPSVSHKKISILPTTNQINSFPMNQFYNSPTRTCGSSLKFCVRSPETQYITSPPPAAYFVIQMELYWWIQIES